MATLRSAGIQVGPLHLRLRWCRAAAWRSSSSLLWMPLGPRRDQEREHKSSPLERQAWAPHGSRWTSWRSRYERPIMSSLRLLTDNGGYKPREISWGSFDPRHTRCERTTLTTEYVTMNRQETVPSTINCSLWR